MEGYAVGLVLQYVQEPKGDRGIYRYRRRVPAELKPFIGKSELIASLGQSKSEALKRYPAIHAAFEKELEIASKTLAREKRKQVSTDQTQLERYEELMDEIRAWASNTRRAALRMRMKPRCVRSLRTASQPGTRKPPRQVTR